MLCNTQQLMIGVQYYGQDSLEDTPIWPLKFQKRSAATLAEDKNLLNFFLFSG